MAENYSRTIHVTTLRHLNFGPVLRIDFNITSTISVPYIYINNERHCDVSILVLICKFFVSFLVLVVVVF